MSACWLTGWRYRFLWLLVVGWPVVLALALVVWLWRRKRKQTKSETY